MFTDLAGNVVTVIGGGYSYLFVRYLKDGRMPGIDTVRLFDDADLNRAKWPGLHVEHIGGLRDWSADLHDSPLVIGLGYRWLALRYEIVHDVLARGRLLPNIVHPSAVVADPFPDERGVIVAPGAIVDVGSTVGPGTMLQIGSTVAHDVTIGSCCATGANVALAGFVTIGDRAFLGHCSVVRDNVTIGDDAMVGMMSSVQADVPAGGQVIGIPAKPVKLRL